MYLHRGGGDFFYAELFFAKSDATNKRLRWLDSHYHDVLADYDTTDLGGGDGVAEPFYALLGEVFDMRGVFKIGKKNNALKK